VIPHERRTVGTIIGRLAVELAEAQTGYLLVVEELEALKKAGGKKAGPHLHSVPPSSKEEPPAAE
jgi:hypothetical protein